MRRTSWLRIIFMLAVTAAIGTLAGYGALRLWSDHTGTQPPVPPADQQVAAVPPVAAPAVQPTAAPQPTPTPRGRAATSPPQTSAKSARRSNSPPVDSPKLQPEAPVRFSSEEPDEAPPTAPPSEKAAALETKTAAPLAPTAGDATLRPQYSMNIDLTRNRQQLAFDVEGKGLTVVGLQGCSEKYDIKPDSIVIKGPRDVFIAVSYSNLSGGKTQVTLEASIKTDAGKSLPFTVRNMEALRRQIAGNVENATNQLVAMKAERNNLDEYTKAENGPKPSQPLAAALQRFNLLKKLIPEADKGLNALKANLDTAEKMSALAKSLNANGVVLFEEKR